MTQAEHLPDVVEEMLFDAGYPRNAELRAALLALGSLASLPAPAPSGDLAMLLAEADDQSAAGTGSTPSKEPSATGQDELAKRRLLRAHRPTVVGLALIAGMGLGVGGVAASAPVTGHSGSPSIQHLFENWAPAWSLPVPNAFRSLPPLNALDALAGRGGAAMQEGEQHPGPSEETAFGAGSSAIANAAKDQSVPAPAPEAGEVNTRGHETHAGTQRGGPQGAAADSGTSGAAADSGTSGAAAARDTQGAGAGRLEPATGRDTGPQNEANNTAGAVPGARADSVPGVLSARVLTPPARP